jgi:membrane-associated protease RseP (regulator of RpoE activity)
MSQNPMPSEPAQDPGLTTCLNCHTPMPSALRFCRNCGFRLGEGVAEYTETVRFDENHKTAFANNPAAGQPLTTTYGLSAGMTPPAPGVIKKRKKMSGMTWMFLGLLVFFIAAAAFTAIITPRRNSPMAPITAAIAPRSHFGVDGLDDAEGVPGATFHNVEPPDGPADKAGLVGGDIITSFDGHNITDEDDLSELLQSTPIGKTVDVTYIRDGETKTAKLTTVGRDEVTRLERAFRNRAAPRGLFGYEDGRAERVQVPGMSIYGVKLNEINSSAPADLAGIKEGDIVIEFDKIPIRTKEEFLSRVRRAIPYSTIIVKVVRGTETIEIPVKMGRQS